MISSSPSFGPPSSSSPTSFGRNIYLTQMEKSPSSSQIPPSSLPPLTRSTNSTPPLLHQRSPLRRRVLTPYPLLFADAPDLHPSILRDSDGWFHPSILRQLRAALTRNPSPVLPHLQTVAPTLLTEQDPFVNRPLPTWESPTTTGVSTVDHAIISNRTVHSGNVPSVTSLPLDISPLPAVLASIVSLDTTRLSAAAALLMLMTEVVPQMYEGGNVTEIPFVDESTERELLSLLGDWYEPKSIESLFPSMPSDAVFFSS